MGIIHTMNLNYPPGLKYTFVVLHELVIGLEGSTLSKKGPVLKNRLSEDVVGLFAL